MERKTFKSQVTRHEQQVDKKSQETRNEVRNAKNSRNRVKKMFQGRRETSSETWARFLSVRQTSKLCLVD